MPQFFLERADVELGDFDNEPDFSGSHDKTIDLVQAGTYDAAALNEQIWLDRTAKGIVDSSKGGRRCGARRAYPAPVGDPPRCRRALRQGVTDRSWRTLLALKASDAQDKEIDLFGAKRFLPTRQGDHEVIERAGRETGLLR